MLNKVELERANEFREKHSKCYRRFEKTAKFKITVEATGIADGVEIKCCSCKKSKNISDYESW